MQQFMTDNAPVLDYDALTPEAFLQTMQHYGCVLIKKLFNASEVEHIKKETLDLFYIIKNLQHNNLINDDNKKYISGGHPAGILPSLSSLEHVLDKSRFVESLKAYFKKDTFVVNVESTGIRRCDPNEWKNFLPWHQDLFHRQDSFMTCWMPLMTIDEKTPGLDLVPKKAHQKVSEQDGIDVAYNGKGLSDELINEKVSPLRWRPAMEVGDVLLFDPYCPHRTSYHEDFTTERFSIDIRIHPKDCVPDETWKENAIQLPASKPYEAPKVAERSVFQLRHLVDLALPSPEQQRFDLAPVPSIPETTAGKLKQFLLALLK